MVDMQKLATTGRFFISKINPLSLYFGLIVALFIFLLLMGYFNRPISDDYSFASKSLNPIQFALYGYTSGNGRLGQYFTFSLYESTLGLRRAVMLAPVINTVLLALSSSYLVFLALTKCNLRNINYLRSSLLLGFLSALAMVFSARSIFDSSLWLDSSVSYIPSLIFLILDVAVLLKLLSNKKPHTSSLGLFFGLVWVGQQFSEPTSVIIIVGFGIALLISSIKLKWNAILLTAIGLVASIVGLLTIYFSPGSQARRAAYHSTLDLHAMLIGSTSYFRYAFELLFSWRLGLFIALGLLLFFITKKAKPTYKTLSLGLAISVALILLPYYIFFVTSEYSLPGYIALRTYQVPASLTAIGVAVSVAILLFYSRSVFKLKDYAWALIVCLSISVTFGLSFKPLSVIVKAEAIRSVQYDYRELSLRQQLAAGSTTIHVSPAPILLKDAEPGEFNYLAGHQIPWFTQSFKTYYGLDGKDLLVETAQTTPYCLTHQNIPWWNISSCENLVLEQWSVIR